MKRFVKRLLRSRGYDVTPYDVHYSFPLRRAAILKRCGVDLVLDIGAHEGLYAQELRSTGYAGNVVSFEPRADAFNALLERSAGDSRWHAMRVAIGERNSDAIIHVSGRRTSSSLLQVTSAHLHAAPDSEVVATESVSMRTLDQALSEISVPFENAWLKVDVQGYEAKVLDGSARSLKDVVGIEIELSLLPMYEGSGDALSLMNRIGDLGFRPCGFQNVLTDRTSGILLQADGLFIRNLHQFVATTMSQ